MPAVPASAARDHRGNRREGLSPGPPATLTVRSASQPNRTRSRVKGAKFSHLAGPWASAAASLPPLPLVGRQRMRAGLGHIPLEHEEKCSIRQERAARALVSLLPLGSASFVLDDPPSAISARDPADVAEAMVGVLRGYGVSSLSGAHSALGRLLSWASALDGPPEAITGSTFRQFLDAQPYTTGLLGHFRWLRDWCGVDLAVRGSAARPYRNAAPASSNGKETLTLSIVLAIEYLAAHHPQPFVRAHAAGWFFLAKAALRLEQSAACVVNSIVQHQYAGQLFSVAVASVRRDKHPDRSKRRPRPAWAVISGLRCDGAVRAALSPMLEAAASLRCILLDTDSPSGDPACATSWLLSPLDDKARVDASLHSVLALSGVPPALARAFHGHAAKRFILCVAKDSPAFDDVLCNELGRFSGSTAQAPGLEPIAAMLHAHTARCSVMPAIYAGKQQVMRALDLLCRVELVLQAATARLPPGPPTSFGVIDSWGESGLFADSVFTSPSQPLPSPASDGATAAPLPTPSSACTALVPLPPPTPPPPTPSTGECLPIFRFGALDRPSV